MYLYSSTLHIAVMGKLTVNTNIKKEVSKVWEGFTNPASITKWNFASNDWHCPSAENNLTEGGTFSYKMAAKDGSFSFDFGGTFNRIEPHKKLAYTLGDGRKVEVLFHDLGEETQIEQTFETEGIHPEKMQEEGWQAILDQFKKFMERGV